MGVCNGCPFSSRSLSGMVARTKTILTENQKKTDYKPEVVIVTNYTQVHVTVCAWSASQWYLHVFFLNLI